jgi:hypothetical protein
MDCDSILKGVEPEGLGQVGISKHGTDLVQKGLVHMLSHIIMLRCVGHHHFIIGQPIFTCPLMLAVVFSLH